MSSRPYSPHSARCHLVRVIAIGAILTLVTTLLISGRDPASALRSSSPGTTLPGSGDVLAPPDPTPQAPEARVSWTRPPTVDDAWDSYDVPSHAYDPALADHRYRVDLRGCDSTVASWSTTELTWQITDPEGTTSTLSWDHCDASFIARTEGPHSVTLRLDTPYGTDTETVTVDVRDDLVIALGDSMTSGEGNINRDGGTAWNDYRCHRSEKSWATRAARDLEHQSQKWSVTYLNLACSGAEIDTGVMEPYGGMETSDLYDDTADMPAQVDQLRTWLCGTSQPEQCRPDARRVDTIVLSMGVNDMSFSSIIVDCASDVFFWQDSCDEHEPLRNAAGAALFKLRSDFAAFAEIVDEHFPGTRVLVAEYPDDPFDAATGGSGCGALFNIDDDEAAWLHELGQRLNRELKRATLRHGYTLIEGVAEGFRGRGYCSSSSWFVDLSDSLANQRNKDGTLHPDEQGHRFIADRALDALATPAPAHELVGHAVVTVTGVMAEDPHEVGENGLVADEHVIGALFTTTSIAEGLDLEYTYARMSGRSVPNGEAVDLTGDDLVMRVPIYSGQSLRLRAESCLGPIVVAPTTYLAPSPFDDPTRWDFEDILVDDPPDLPEFDSRCIRPLDEYGFSESYGSGTQTLSGSAYGGAGTFEVTYRISFEPARPGRFLGIPQPLTPFA